MTSTATTGHPDHVQVHRVGLRAGELAGVPRVFMATVNRDYLLRSARDGRYGAALRSAGDEGPEVDNLGEPEERITTVVDVSRFLETKRRAMEAHASQISETSFFLSMPPEAFAAVWG